MKYEIAMNAKLAVRAWVLSLRNPINVGSDETSDLAECVNQPETRGCCGFAQDLRGNCPKYGLTSVVDTSS
jgi:hypothetical protein